MSLHGTTPLTVVYAWDRFELRGTESLPVGEAAACREAFDREIGLDVATAEGQSAWTMWRRAWRASWMHGVKVRGTQVRAAMGEG